MPKATLEAIVPAGDQSPGIEEVFGLLGRAYGPVEWTPRYDPISELVFTILSQHTSDRNAERTFPRLLAAFGSWEAVAGGSEEDIARAIWNGGLARVKAPRIKAILTHILEQRSSLDLSFLKDMPLAEAKAWLRGLPGVGPKTAAVVLCFSLEMPAMPVDTHIHRVVRRLGLVPPGATAEQAHTILEGVVPPERVFPLHVYLITHGRQVCKAQRPRCRECVLAALCPRVGVA